MIGFLESRRAGSRGPGAGWGGTGRSRSPGGFRQWDALGLEAPTRVCSGQLDSVQKR